MKILLADDDRIVRKILRKLLERELPCEIREVEDGADCWQALEDGYRPDLCLLDLDMPRLGGLGLLARVRGDERFRGLRAIVVSSNTDPQSRRLAKELGALGFVSKPFNPKRLCALARAALESEEVEQRSFYWEDRQVAPKKIVTRADSSDWSDDKIRLSAEIEESHFDERGGFSFGSESILLRGFRGDRSVAMARMEVKNGRVVISALFDETNQLEVDLSRFSPHLAQR